MKILQLLSTLTICAFVLTARLYSQSPAGPKTPVQTLQGLKVQNQQLLEKQTATLLKLEELQKDATQIKILAKRT